MPPNLAEEGSYLKAPEEGQIVKVSSGTRAEASGYRPYEPAV